MSAASSSPDSEWARVDRPIELVGCLVEIVQGRRGHLGAPYPDQACERIVERVDRHDHPPHLALELVQALHRLAVAVGEHVAFDLDHVVLEPVERGPYPSITTLTTAATTAPGPKSEAVGIGFERGPRRRQLAGLAVANRDHRTRTDEQRHLAERDGLVAILVGRGAQHELHDRSLDGEHGPRVRCQHLRARTHQ